MKSIILNDAFKLHNPNNYYKYMLFKVKNSPSMPAIEKVLNREIDNISFIDKMAILSTVDKDLLEGHYIDEFDYVKKLLNNFSENYKDIKTDNLSLDDIKEIIATLIKHYFLGLYEKDAIPLTCYFISCMNERIDNIKNIVPKEPNYSYSDEIESKADKVTRFYLEDKAIKEKLIIFFNRGLKDNNFFKAYKHLFKELFLIGGEEELNKAYEYDFQTPEEVEEIAQMYEKTIRKSKS